MLKNLTQSPEVSVPLTRLTNRYLIPHAHQRRGDVRLTAVQIKVTVRNQLTRLRARIRKSQTIDCVVKTPRVRSANL